jgi:hypothetical protein
MKNIIKLFGHLVTMKLIHSDIENDDKYLTESIFFKSAVKGESEESLDDVYDPYYKTKNYLNVIPKNELD